MPILTGLGCSYKCTFCEHALINSRHHALEAKDIVKQMNYYYEKYNIDSFAFFDEEFLSDKERIFELTDLLKNNTNKFYWGTQVRASDIHERYINKERLQQIEESGCIRFSMGVESGSPRMLKKIKKGLTPEIVIRAANFGKNSKIGPDVSLGDNVSVGNDVVISNSLIMDNTIIESNTCVSDSIVSGKNILSLNNKLKE